MAYTRDRLGDLLLREAVITEQQLAEALAEQGDGGGKLGQILVRSGATDEESIARTLAEQKGIEFVSLPMFPIDREAASLIPARMAKRSSIIPVGFRDGSLVLAMADPLDVEAIDDVHLRTGRSVIPVVATVAQIEYAIEKFITSADAFEGLAVAVEDEEAEEVVAVGDEDVPIVRLVNQLIREATHDGASDIRVSMLVCGVWIALFTIPAFLVLRDRPRPLAPRVGIADSYRLVWRSIRALWSSSRHTVYFLMASALFRDGLAGVFAFGAILAAGTFGLSAGEVIIFGAAANIVAGLATIAFGMLDDRIGPKRVILICLASLVVLGLLVFVFHDGGKTVFWVLGLLLTVFVGPAQAASRSFLARLIPQGKSGEIFGLYATTGRVVSFLSPLAFGAFIAVGALVTGEDNTQYWGILGIVLILAAGFAVMLPVKEHGEHTMQ